MADLITLYTLQGDLPPPALSIQNVFGEHLAGIGTRTEDRRRPTANSLQPQGPLHPPGLAPRQTVGLLCSGLKVTAMTCFSGEL